MGQEGDPEGPEYTTVTVQEPPKGPHGFLSEESLLPPWSPPEAPPEPCPHCGHKVPVFLTRRLVTPLLVTVLVTVILVVGLVVLFVGSKKSQLRQNEGVQDGAAEYFKDTELLPSCGDGWIWYRNKCFHFSEAEGTWKEAEGSCSAMNSTLAMIDTREELNFTMFTKGTDDHWIGLKRDTSKEPWKWASGTLFNNWFTIEDYSECAYIHDSTVRSAQCYNTRQWVCTKVPSHEKKRTKRTLNSEHFSHVGFSLGHM